MALKLLSIAVTWRCALRCDICGIWKQPPSEPAFIDLGRLESALADPFFDSLQYVNLFGGEPVLHPDLPRIVEWARRRFPRAHERAVVTGGWRALPVIERLAAADPDLMVCVSIDGFAPIHDARRGVEGSYDEAMRCLVYAGGAFTKRPRISVTVCPGQTEALTQVARIAEYYRAEVALRPVVRGSYFRGEADAGWTAAQVDELERVLATLPDRAKGSLEFTAAMAAFLRDGAHRPCRCKGRTGVVDPDGTFRICHSHPAALAIEEVPRRWSDLVREAEGRDCFLPECFIDGPYALSYLSAEHAPWLT